MVYQDPNVTDVACAGLNGMRMGERVLTVRRATEVGQSTVASCSSFHVSLFEAMAQTLSGLPVWGDMHVGATLKGHKLLLFSSNPLSP